ncbi:hypothetical protein GUITHDRAFT_153879 [Guillardia theta CCMP2712]|uniref:YchJ-like middle NTF2-like domain-containing protein n=1 Tax=Guillardia theta (strain CCMP2712) TaxID=905079 RepID=L1IZC6_GUITC|nr:hypothetical protein GUITHDRAFT_153879 [Guillardia theta CCMP2712]EKX41180.1 hypothetical protein GUITHDRAFT_153879 [Guillardia theta CCMP2712]|eukprot:XP_005828160.1 hypothetical protein GUITHDRAFT_153879 [Guillardia theta CCMP2712]
MASSMTFAPPPPLLLLLSSCSSPFPYKSAPSLSAKSFSQHSSAPGVTSLAMAAKSKGSSSSFKGFGSVPTELLGRTPEDSESCACCSGASYGECCKQIHDGVRWPSTPLEMIRSRYSAYAYRLPTWIMDSTHSTNPDWRSQRNKWRNELLGFCDGFDFVRLEILKEEGGQDSDEHFIEFIARLRAKEKAPENAPKGVKQTLRRVKLHGASDSSSADFRLACLICEGGWQVVLRLG